LCQLKQQLRKKPPTESPWPAAARGGAQEAGFGAPEARKTPKFAAGYINFYVCNGAVIAPQFSDSLDIDAIAAGGGGIHRTTQQPPR
jgi:agmatine/peptidylarginine deiminase